METKENTIRIGSFEVNRYVDLSLAHKFRDDPKIHKFLATYELKKYTQMFGSLYAYEASRNPEFFNNAKKQVNDYNKYNMIIDNKISMYV